MGLRDCRIRQGQGYEMKPNEILDALVSGRVEEVRAIFDERCAEAISAHELQRVWASAVEELGDYIAATDPIVLHDIPLTFSRGRAHLQLAYRGERVTGMVLKPGGPTAKFGQ